MLDFLSISTRDLMIGAGVGGIVIPLSCFALRQIAQKMGYKPPPPPLPNPDDQKQPNRDQLQGIEGVGPKIALILCDAGLNSFAAIAAKKPSEIQSVLDQSGPAYKLANPATWPRQAQLLAAGDIDGFLKLAFTLTAGVTVLENINGIGPAYGERLRLSGINTVAKLAKSQLANIRTALGETEASVSNETISDWIAQARQFSSGSSRALGELAGNLQRATLPGTATDALAGPAQTPRSLDGANGADQALPWLQRNSGPVCAATLSSLLLIGSVFVSPLPPIENYWERDCMLDNRITFPDSALFIKDSTKLSSKGESNLRDFIAKYKNETTRDGGSPDRIIVIGFASSEGNSKRNQILSEQRARTTENRLILETSWSPKLFKSFGRGAIEARACSEGSEEVGEICLAKDRKVEILVLYDFSNPRSVTRSCGAPRKYDAVALAAR